MHLLDVEIDLLDVDVRLKVLRKPTRLRLPRGRWEGKPVTVHAYALPSIR